MQMYGLSPEQVKPGTPTSELIQHRLKLGLKVRMAPEDYIRERVGRDIALDTTVQEFTDGRIIAYTVRPMPDGGGIATHEDITEREELHARLKRQYELGKEQEEALRIRNFQFDTAINNMSQGLCFFDADHKLIVCNDRFLEMYDIPPGRVGPGTPLTEIVDLRYRGRQFPGDVARRICALAHQGRRLQRSQGQHRRAAERPHLQDPPPADARSRLGRHPRRHHRAAPGRGQDRAHGAPRCADRSGQPGVAERAAGAGAGPLPGRADGGGPSPRPRSVQGGQRHVRPSRRRQAAQDRRRTPARTGARDRHHRADGRRRIRHRPGADRRSRARPPRWRSRSSHGSASPTTSTASRPSSAPASASRSAPATA